jgi:hypothetical protein
MIWDIVGATGEWVGAIAVVVTLYYLARQIRLSNLQAQAAARYSFLEAYGQAATAISASTQASSVYRRGLMNELDDDDEEMQFIVLLGQFMNTWSVMFDLHEEGQLPPNQWYLVNEDILSAFSTPGGRVFWDKIGRKNVHASFVQHVDELLGSGTVTYSMLPEDVYQRNA